MSSRRLLASSVSTLIVAVLLQGCSHDLDRRLDQKVEQEPAVSGSGQLQLEARAMINRDKGLTPDEKNKLTALLDQTRKKMADLKMTSLKLRSILIKDLNQPNYDADEVDLIKSRLRKVEDERLSTIFDVIDQVNAIVGRKTAENEKYLRTFFDEQHSRRD